LGLGETDDINMYSFIMARCCNYCSELPEATGVLVGCCHPALIPLLISGHTN